MINVNNMRTDNRRDIQYNDVISEEVKKNKINEAKIAKKVNLFPFVSVIIQLNLRKV